jgi:hypothetical protein
MSQQDTPDVISINLTWEQSSPQAVLTTLNMIPNVNNFQFGDDGSAQMPGSGSGEKQYYFKGMI